MRDLRRDAALAALGWVVLRFSYVDITERGRFCAAQVATVYRRRQMDGLQAGTPTPRTPASGTSIG